MLFEWQICTVRQRNLLSSTQLPNPTPGFTEPCQRSRWFRGMLAKFGTKRIGGSTRKRKSEILTSIDCISERRERVLTDYCCRLSFHLNRSKVHNRWCARSINVCPWCEIRTFSSDVGVEFQNNDVWRALQEITCDSLRRTRSTDTWCNEDNQLPLPESKDVCLWKYSETLQERCVILSL